MQRCIIAAASARDTGSFGRNRPFEPFTMPSRAAISIYTLFVSLKLPSATKGRPPSSGSPQSATASCVSSGDGYSGGCSVEGTSLLSVSSSSAVSSVLSSKASSTGISSLTPFSGAIFSVDSSTDRLVSSPLSDSSDDESNSADSSSDCAGVSGTDCKKIPNWAVKSGMVICPSCAIKSTVSRASSPRVIGRV